MCARLAPPRAHTQSPPRHATQRPALRRALSQAPLAILGLCCAAGGCQDGQRRGDQPAAATELRQGQDVRPRADSIRLHFSSLFRRYTKNAYKYTVYHPLISESTECPQNKQGTVIAAQHLGDVASVLLG
eukprot:scaffold61762_cov63-Phaeocystis_antarctica.AAC.3